MKIAYASMKLSKATVKSTRPIVQFKMNAKKQKFGPVQSKNKGAKFSFKAALKAIL
jgi:hypothetical protein